MISTIIIIITFILLTLSILFFPSIKLGKIKLGTFWIVALVGAATLLCCGQLPFDVFIKRLTADASINPLKILILFFSMTFLSVYLDEAGFFKYLASFAASKARGNMFSLFAVTYFLTAFLTVFTSNDIVILTFTPFICFFCKNTDTNPIPFLVGEFAAANTWSMALIIGNPTNVYLATSFGIGFTEYFKTMALPTVFAGMVEFLLMILIFWKKLKKPLVASIEIYEVKNKAEVCVGLVALIGCLVFLVISDVLSMEMWFVSACCAVALLIAAVVIRICKKKNAVSLWQTAKRLPWQLVPFVLSMFAIVVCLEYQGIAARLGAFLGDKYFVWTYGGASFLVSNLINNIPMSILFGSLPTALEGSALKQAIYASVVGSNVGAFLTPIGALAGIMFSSLAEEYDVKYGFKEFIRYGGVIALPTLAAALLPLFLLIK